ncbi:MAG: porin family protein [Salinibacter sp.]|uniref:porin family protein n=1 Tax=Salinibacter sp. TaxID=2065818 RepID=UPI0035D5076C
MDHPRQILFTAFSVLALVAFSLAPMKEARAQEAPGAFYIGFSGGLNQSSFGNVTANSRQGYAAGVSFTYNFNEVFSGEFGVLHSRKGANGVTASAPNRPDAVDFEGDDIRLDYYHFPLLAKLTAPIEAVKIRAFAGPAFDFIRTAAINGQKSRPDIQAQQPAKERFRPFDVEAVLGGEIAIPVPSPVSEIAIDGRYHFGFLDVDAAQQFSMKQRTFTGTVSLRFEL